MIWVVGGPVLVFKYGFWVASDLCIIYVLFKYICFILFVISSCFVSIFTTLFSIVFLLALFVLENVGFSSGWILFVLFILHVFIITGYNVSEYIYVYIIPDLYNDPL